MKMFKAKKVKKKKKIYKKIFLFLFVIAYIYAFKYCYDNKKEIDINIINKNINFYNFNLTDTINKKIDNIINKPVNFLNNNIKSASKLNSNVYETKTKKSENATVMIEVKKENEPIIYIYNTHETEKYNDYSVKEASSLLSKKLNNIENISIVENKSVASVLKVNNLKYYKSYSISKEYLKEAKENYNSLNYFFDIHRDSVDKNKSTYTYNNKSYAKVLFIVGLDNKNYQSNLDNANKLNDIINKNVKGISRGIIKKQGKGVDGVYNQDFSPNAFLIEVGGLENTKEEVENTIDVISSSIKEYIGIYDKL